MPQLKLTEKEKFEFFHAALCNGLNQLRAYGISLKIKDEEYQKAKQNTKVHVNATICREDVFIQMLKDGYTIRFNDDECGEYTADVSADSVKNNMEKVPFEHLMDMHQENDDAITADVILQTIAFGEIIFG